MKNKTSSRQKPKRRRLAKTILILVVETVGALVAIVLFYHLLYFNRIFPNTFIATVEVSGLKVDDATRLLSQNISVPSKLTLIFQDQYFSIPTSEVGVSYNYSGSVQTAYMHDRTGNIPYDLIERFKSLVVKTKIGLTVNIDEAKLSTVTSAIAGQVETDSVPPKISLQAGQVVVEQGKSGLKINKMALRAAIADRLTMARQDAIMIPVNIIDPVLTQNEVLKARERAQKFLSSSLTLTYDSYSQIYKAQDVLPLINPRSGFNRDEIAAIVDKTAQSINRTPQNPVFEFTEGKVKEFKPALVGRAVDEEELSRQIVGALEKIESGTSNNPVITIAVITTKPSLATEDVNSLGIKELIGKGVSYFRGSASSRIHNIILASSKLNGVLIKPGEIFSFNNALGDVSVYTGYKQAFIIQNGRTVLGDGGGVCQVSTTFFRAALDAGLPILERRAHSYRVSYYEQGFPPGLDATVYAPTADLKIKNDTPGHILIQTKVNTKTSTLIFEFYGTDDGRVATKTKPKVSNFIPAPPDLYQDDPRLPTGTIKQVDYAAPGAKVTFSYRVERDGEVIFSKVFNSNYKPWQAVFLRGTGPQI